MEFFNAKKPGETLIYGFDFSNDNALSDGVTIASPTVTAAARTGSDSSASSIISGPAWVNGRVVQQKITGGLDGVDYRLTATATTSDGQVIQMVAVLPVREVN